MMSHLCVRIYKQFANGFIAMHNKVTILNCVSYCLYFSGDDHLLMISMRCLGLLLIPTKTKRVDGDIPFFIQFVPVSTI